MNTQRFKFCLPLVSLFAVVGCDSAPTMSQLSGSVTFKGQPVPSGYITFTPDVGQGSVCVVQIKDGKYDTAAMVGVKGIHPGTNRVRIAGFDGKVVKFWGQGKQIFNPHDDNVTVAPGTTAKSFEVPDSAGKNVKIEPTADE